MKNKELLSQAITEVRDRETAQEIFEFQQYATRWRATLRARFDENNGQAWVRYLRNHFDTQSVFRAVKKDSTADEIYQILLKRKV
jgi:hypothetical protein